MTDIIIGMRGSTTHSIPIHESNFDTLLGVANRLGPGEFNDMLNKLDQDLPHLNKTQILHAALRHFATWVDVEVSDIKGDAFQSYVRSLTP